MNKHTCATIYIHLFGDNWIMIYCSLTFEIVFTIIFVESFIYTQVFVFSAKHLTAFKTLIIIPLYTKTIDVFKINFGM